MGKVIGIILAVAFVFALSFLGTTLLVYGICWAFSLTFSWKIAFGVWLVTLLIAGCVKSTGGSK